MNYDDLAGIPEVRQGTRKVNKQQPAWFTGPCYLFTQRRQRSRKLQ